MPENRYEARAKRLAEWLETTSDRLAERLLGGERPPFMVRLSKEEEYARLASLMPEDVAALVQGRSPEELAALGERMGELQKKYGGEGT